MPIYAIMFYLFFGYFAMMMTKSSKSMANAYAMQYGAKEQGK